MTTMTMTTIDMWWGAVKP